MYACVCVCGSLPVISSENSLSIDGKFECNFEPSSMLLLLFSLFLSGCFWVRKECRARWKAACAQAERTVYTWKSEATARQRTTTMSTTTRDCQLLQARQTDRHDWQALCTFFFWEFFLLLLFPPRKALAICLCTRSVFEYYTKYYFKQLTLGCLSVLVFVAVLQFPHTHTQTLGLDTLATCLLLLWSATENVLTKRATVCGTSVLLLLLQP